MRLLYALGIRLYGLLLRFLSPFHRKAKLWTDGRKNILNHIQQTIDKDQHYIWFHFASLGEFEQGRSVMEQIKERFPSEKIVITFFSPSGFEVRKNTTLAEHVFYLPLDTAHNAREFIRIIKPKFAVFTKYEYWFYYFNELQKQGIPLLMISAIFRQDQIFFKSYGRFFRRILQKVSFFFAQNMESVHLLKWISLTNAGLAGDTRFDRVVELPKQHKALPLIEQFTKNHPVFVGGSTWMPDEQKIQKLTTEYAEWKFIIAPHEIHEEHLQNMIKLFPTAIRYSKLQDFMPQEIEKRQVLIIDNIGMLSSLYFYGNVAYIGGGFGVGIHNTLEAATYGIPVIFGPKHEKYQEAVDLVTLMAGFSIRTEEELKQVFDALLDEQKRGEAGRAARKYVQQRAGATQIIMKYIETSKLLSST